MKNDMNMDVDVDDDDLTKLKQEEELEKVERDKEETEDEESTSESSCLKRRIQSSENSSNNEEAMSSDEDSEDGNIGSEINPISIEATNSDSDDESHDDTDDDDDVNDVDNDNDNENENNDNDNEEHIDSNESENEDEGDRTENFGKEDGDDDVVGNEISSSCEEGAQKSNDKKSFENVKNQKQLSLIEELAIFKNDDTDLKSHQDEHNNSDDKENAVVGTINERKDVTRNTHRSGRGRGASRGRGGRGRGRNKERSRGAGRRSTRSRENVNSDILIGQDCFEVPLPYNVHRVIADPSDSKDSNSNPIRPFLILSFAYDYARHKFNIDMDDTIIADDIYHP